MLIWIAGTCRLRDNAFVVALKNILILWYSAPLSSAATLLCYTVVLMLDILCGILILLLYCSVSFSLPLFLPTLLFFPFCLIHCFARPWIGFLLNLTGGYKYPTVNRRCELVDMELSMLVSLVLRALCSSESAKSKGRIPSQCSGCRRNLSPGLCPL